MRRLLAFSLVLSLFACGADPSNPADAGDADAGPSPDSGDVADAGGLSDAGESTDAGSTCAPGTFVVSGGGCAPCVEGTFSTTENAVVCTSYTPCDTIETAGTSTSDQVCAVDCVIEWTAWSCCRPTNGGPRQLRTGTVTTPASPGGACPVSLAERRACVPEAPICCENAESATACREMSDCQLSPDAEVCSLRPIDCEYSVWSGYSECSRVCLGGTQTRTRTIVREARNGGLPCDGPLSQTQACNSGITCACSDLPDETECTASANPRCVWSGGACVPDPVIACDQIVDEATCQATPLCCEFAFGSCVPRTCF